MTACICRACLSLSSVGANSNIEFQMDTPRLDPRVPATKRVVERPPIWISWAAPHRYHVPGAVISGLAGLSLMALVGVSPWIGVVAGPTVAGVIVDLWWRRTRPPSEDRRWSLLARWLYRRPPSSS